MLEKHCDIWVEPASAICITTNGFVKKDGTLVMGAGTAGQAQSRFPNLPLQWGLEVAKHGNQVFGTYCSTPNIFDGYLIAFPVKHNWYEQADIDLIVKSSQQLMDILDKFNVDKVLLPRPGCGNGRLKWTDVKPEIENILDDRVTVVWNGI